MKLLGPQFRLNYLHYNMNHVAINICLLLIIYKVLHECIIKIVYVVMENLFSRKRIDFEI